MSIEALDWGTLSHDDLDALMDRAKREMDAKRDQRLQALQEMALKVQQEAKALHVSVLSMFGYKKAVRTNLPPKYVHPEDATKTWSGRGKKPGWMVNLLDGGCALETLLVKAEVADLGAD